MMGRWKYRNPDFLTLLKHKTLSQQAPPDMKFMVSFCSLCLKSSSLYNLIDLRFDGWNNGFPYGDSHFVCKVVRYTVHIPYQNILNNIHLRRRPRALAWVS